MSTSGIHMEPNNPIGILPQTTRRKRKATQVNGHPEAHMKRRFPISETRQVQSSIMHDVDVEPSTELMMEQSLPISHWMYLSTSNISHVPVHVAHNESVCIVRKEPVNLGDSNFDPLSCFSDGLVHHSFANACMKSQSGDDLNDELRQFLFQLVNDELDS
eukprot:13991636-Ditylum_brightwellii.AAC.1